MPEFVQDLASINIIICEKQARFIHLDAADGFKTGPQMKRFD